MFMLNDDAVRAIGHYAGVLYGAESYVNFAWTCKRMNRLLTSSDGDDASSRPYDIGENQTIRSVIRARASSILRALHPNLDMSPDRIVGNLEQLTIFEEWISSMPPSFVRDNRIRFPFASTEIAPNMRELCFHTAILMVRHPNVRVRLDSHCGTAAPSGISSWFSRARGLSVRDAICNLEIEANDNEDVCNHGEEATTSSIDQDRIGVIAWGKTITGGVARMEDHPFRTDAREGRGWVEVYFIVPGGRDGDEMVLPPRHAYYQEVDTDSERELQAIFDNEDEMETESHGDDGDYDTDGSDMI
mmetsp:Transcript_24108/g.58228  ORF Transcript_24108/g.58228 Transcript_24108/m.58228 type:complete len:302 (-) Transcript_24108:463-1368(-)